MDRQGLLNFNQQAATVRNDLFGVDVIINGERVAALDSSVNANLELPGEGFRVTGLWRFRLPRSFKLPEIAAEVLRVGTGQKFSVISTVPAPADSADNLYHVIEAQPL